MPLISLIVVIALCGLALWFVERFIPMDPVIKRILQGVVVFVLIVWLLSVFGILGSLDTVTVPRVR